MGFFRDALDALTLGPTQGDVDDVVQRRANESEAQSGRLARAHTRQELERMLTAERERMPRLLDGGSAQEIDANSRLVGDIMAALELQQQWGL